MNYRPWFEAALFLLLLFFFFATDLRDYWNSISARVITLKCRAEQFGGSMYWRFCSIMSLATGLGKFQAVGLYNSNLILQTKSKRLAELLKYHNKGERVFCRPWHRVELLAGSHFCQRRRKARFFSEWRGTWRCGAFPGGWRTAFF